MRAELSTVSKKFGGTFALRDISVDVPAGTLVAVLGLNGAGKSTLLRAMAGVCSLDAGEIRYDGEKFQRERLDLRRRMMFTPDMPVLFADKTVLRNVTTFLHVYEREVEGREEEIVAKMEFAGVASLAGRAVGGLSRGQLWKVALACAATVMPAVWLVDEPFASGMDVVGLDAFRKVARQLTEAGGIVLYTTQLVSMAAEFSDRVCLLDRGEIRLWDTQNGLRQRLAAAGGEADLFRGLIGGPDETA